MWPIFQQIFFHEVIQIYDSGAKWLLKLEQIYSAELLQGEKECFAEKVSILKRYCRSAADLYIRQQTGGKTSKWGTLQESSRMVRIDILSPPPCTKHQKTADVSEAGKRKWKENGLKLKCTVKKILIFSIISKAIWSLMSSWKEVNKCYYVHRNIPSLHSLPLPPISSSFISGDFLYQITLQLGSKTASSS